MFLNKFQMRNKQSTCWIFNHNAATRPDSKIVIATVFLAVLQASRQQVSCSFLIGDLGGHQTKSSWAHFEIFRFSQRSESTIRWNRAKLVRRCQSERVCSEEAKFSERLSESIYAYRTCRSEWDSVWVTIFTQEGQKHSEMNIHISNFSQQVELTVRF